MGSEWTLLDPTRMRPVATLAWIGSKKEDELREREGKSLDRTKDRKTMKSSSSLLLFFFFSASLFSVLTAEFGDGDGSPAVHIVHVKQSDGQEEPEAYHIRILASVLGSEKAAKDALVYHYKHAASGFSAKLTPKQASDLSKFPGVLLVSPSGKIHLHSGLGSIHRMAVLP